MRQKRLAAAMFFVLTALLSVNVTAQTTHATHLAKTSTKTQLVHQTIDVNVSFERFSQNLEKILGKYSTAGADNVLKNPELAVASYKAMEGEQGLMLFGALQHGNLMNLGGSPRKGKRYYVGNPLVAYQMMSKDFRAGLYAPLSVLVYEPAPGATRIEYDMPSTTFGQFGNRAVTEIAESLDAKLEKLIEKATELSRQ